MGGGRGEVSKHKKINKEGVEEKGSVGIKRVQDDVVDCVGMADGKMLPSGVSGESLQVRVKNIRWGIKTEIIKG